MLFDTKEEKIERTCAMQERSAQFKISFDKWLFVEDFEGMQVFLQESKYVPTPGGAECMLCTITIKRDHPIRQKFPQLGRKMILVGTAFMELSHVKKLILLRAEQLRQDQNLTADFGRPEGIVSTSLDREIAARQRLAWEFNPKLIERTLRGRDRVVVRSTTKVSQGIYANSDDHYKPWQYSFGQNGKKNRCFVIGKRKEDTDAEHLEKTTDVMEKSQEVLKSEA